MSERIAYDEFAYFADNAAEYGIDWAGPPKVARATVRLGDGRSLSALVWADGDPPPLVLLHGGAQNAHTWDTVALALARPLVALDLPGHGHSDDGRHGALGLADNVADVATALEALAATPAHVVGMSLGGMTALALADARPDLVRSLLLVDITPGVTGQRASAITDFVAGPASFADLEDLLERTMAFNPTRTESSLRRGILHNALQREDGSWVWRHQRFARPDEPSAASRPQHPDFGALWGALDRSPVPLTLARGLRDQSVVSDEDEQELRRRRPDARVEYFAESGHSIQGDQPVELARLIADHVDAADTAEGAQR